MRRAENVVREHLSLCGVIREVKVMGIIIGCFSVTHALTHARPTGIVAA
jgi:hypothetical protein